MMDVAWWAVHVMWGTVFGNQIGKTSQIFRKGELWVRCCI